MVTQGFGGYAERYNAAVARVVTGENRWVDGFGIDSCHVVWMQRDVGGGIQHLLRYPTFVREAKLGS